MYNTLSVMTLAQVIAQCGAPIVVLLGGIVGAETGVELLTSSAFPSSSLRLGSTEFWLL